ncbi:MAG: hypothetical protein R3246_15440, partial [Acidimicrobiia bacterium]|nr:hypothetical protein [Acidimicrobiia bacterium]
MATWVRNLSSGPSASDADVAGTVELDNGTAPGDFDPDAVNSVRIQMTFGVSAGTLSDDTHTAHRAAALTLDGDGTDLANVDAGDATIDSGTTSVSLDLTDSSIPTGHTAAEWEGTELNEIDAFHTVWTTYNQTKGKDGATVAVTAATVTIDYTPSSGDASVNPATINAPTAVGAATTGGGQVPAQPP